MNFVDRRSRRRRWIRTTALSLVAVALSSSGVSASEAETPSIDAIPDVGVVVDLAAIAMIPDSSFGSAPRLNMITFVGERIFIVEERDGLIYELIADGTSARTALVFFDVKQAIDQATDQQLDTSSVFHGGLRSVAFHPDFASNGLLYVSAMETRPSNPAAHHYISDADAPIAADSVLIEFTFDHVSETIDPLSYREVFRVGMPVYDHPIKQIAFDPEATGADRGLLFIAHGDGSVLSAIAGGGQNNDALGKILRIDPMLAGASNYSVPEDNPFVGDPAMPDEVYSIGHRNPHQLAFARNPLNGARLLIAAEAGRDNVEEINLIEPGADYGWPQREGTFMHLAAGGRASGIAPLPPDEQNTGFAYPATQYLHSGTAGSTETGEAVAGGFVVDNGSALSGLYFFTDFPTRGALLHSKVDDMTAAVRTVEPGLDPTSLTQADIGLAAITFDHDGDPATTSVSRTDLRDVFDDAPGYETTRADVRIGQGPLGELFIMSKRNNTVYLVTNSVPPPEEAQTESPRYLDDQILRLYRAALGRAPDEQGLQYWVDRHQSGQSLTDIAESFVASPEFVERFGIDPDPDALVTLLYNNVLGRPGEAEGFAFWLERLTNGMTAAAVVIEFSDSIENIARTNTTAPLTSNESKVLRLYRAALGRAPDENGMRYWVDRYETGSSLTDLAREFRRSPEFDQRFGTDLSDQAFIDLLYRNVLDRSGDSAGVTFWVGQLAARTPRDDVLAQFAESPENLTRTNTRP